MAMDLKSTEFRVKVNDINQVTILKNIRELYGIKSGDEIILEFKGKVNSKINKAKTKKSFWNAWRRIRWMKHF